MAELSKDTKAVAIGLALLGFNSMFVSSMTTMAAITFGAYPAKEDLVVYKLPFMSYLLPHKEDVVLRVEPDGKEPQANPEIFQRAHNAHRNATENAVMLGCFYMVYYLSEADDELARQLIVASAASRLLHGPSYIFKWQPWRTIAHVVAELLGAPVAWIGLKHMGIV